MMSPARIRQRGFTLLELLVTMAISTIVLLAAAAVLRYAGDGYERTGSGIGTEREARAAIAQLASDLATAQWNTDAPIDKSTTDWPADAIGLLSLQPAVAQSDDGRIGDLCAVYYYLHDFELPDGRFVRCLMRRFRESQETFTKLKANETAALFTPDNTDEPIAFGVLSFEARPKQLQINTGAAATLVDWVPGSGLPPHSIEARIVLVRRGLAARLRTPADWNGAGAAAQDLGNATDASENEHLVVYSTLIPYGSHAK